MRLSCGFPFFSDTLMQLSLPACHICYCELSTFEVFFHRGVQNRDQQQKNQQVSNFIFSPVFWAIGIAAVFLSAMHFAKLRLLVDDLFRHLRILISPASSASTVSLCKRPPHVSESAQKYFFWQPQFGETSTSFWLWFNQSMLWTQEEDDTGLVIQCS